MKLPHYLKTKNFGADARPRAPQAIFHVPPGGMAVHCSSVEEAQDVAKNFAAENPGKTAAVYQLVGYAFRPIETPDFVPVASDEAKEQLLDCTPGSTLGEEDGLEVDDGATTDRPDLSPEQRETLSRVRAVMRDGVEGE